MRALSPPATGLPVVVYAAKSTEDVRASIPRQIEDCRATIESAGGRVIVGEWEDEAKSAFKGNRGDGLVAAKRCATDAAAAAGWRPGDQTHAAELWVQHSDRIARGDGLTADHLAEVFFAMRRVGVRLRSVQDDSNLEDAVRAVLIGERNTEDSRRKSLAVRGGKRARFEAGKAVGGPLNDGYRLVPQRDSAGNVVVERGGRVIYDRELDPERRPLIERIFDLVEAGHTPGDIARQLNGEGHKTRLGKTWGARGVRHIVGNPYYAGRIVMHGDVAQGSHPPLIDPERFDRIQAQRRRLDPVAVQARKGGRRPVEDFLLRGVAFCGCCHDTMYTRRMAAGRVYICRGVREGRGTCSAPAIPAQLVEQAALAHLQSFFLDVGAWIEERTAERTSERESVERALASEQRELERLQHDVELVEADYMRQLRGGKDDVAGFVFEQLQKAQAKRDHQAAAVGAIEARLQSWEETPDTDALLDFWSELQAVVDGKLRTAQSAKDLNAALRQLLDGAWMATDELEDGTATVHVKFSMNYAIAGAALLEVPSVLSVAIDRDTGEGMTTTSTRGRRQTGTDTFVKRPVWTPLLLPPLEFELTEPACPVCGGYVRQSVNGARRYCSDVCRLHAADVRRGRHREPQKESDPAFGTGSLVTYKNPSGEKGVLAAE
jgi:hypothetical protein